MIPIRWSAKDHGVSLRNFLTLLLLLLCIPFYALVYSSVDPYDPDECSSMDSAASSETVYQGKLNKAFDGTECQPWSAHPHFYRSHWTKEKAAQEKNYCRNPDNDSHGPWCVVHKTTFKYCNVPRCAKDVECYEGNGEEYSGSQDRTADGVPCKTWTQTGAVRTSRKLYRFRVQENDTHSSVLRLTDDMLDKFQYCRNPAGSRARPWCYTIPMTGVKNEYSYCDVPKCSDPSPLGYINFGTGSPCASGFVQQTQTLLFQGTRKIKMTYCLAPTRLLYPKQRQPQYKDFTDFCLYLMEKFTFCPAGFRRMERLQSNFGPIKHFTGPSVWRTTSENILQQVFCCSDPDYFRNYTPKPYIMVEKVARYKPFMQDVPELSAFPLQGLRQTRQTDQPYLFTEMHHPRGEAKNYSLSFDISDEIDRSTSSDVIFASVRRCPMVEGTTRVLSSRAWPQKDSDVRIDLQFTLPEEVVCEYYAVKTSADTQGTQQEKLPAKLGLLINQPDCPNGFRKSHLPRQVVLLLGASATMCEPLENQLDSLTPSVDGYCVIVVSEDASEPNAQYPAESEWGRPSRFSCPQGFRPNELHFTQPDFRLKLCCTGSMNETEQEENTRKADEPTGIQVPFGVSYPFSFIRNGEQCPTFYSGSIKFNVVQYTRPIPASALDKLELIGKDDPVAPSGLLGITVCQYLSQDTKLGVKSLTYDCDGLGNRSSMSYDGATCGFEVNESVTFPPGRYCLLQMSAFCPTGFTQRSAVVRLGFSLQALGTTCCRTEESVGAIRFPVKMSAPFKLPAVHRPCQAIENFNVDAELHHCVYYPQGETPQALLMWPRIVSKVDSDETSDHSTSATPTVSAPKNCAVMPRRRRKLQRSQMGRLTTLFFSLMHDQWLIYKRPRWITKVTDNVDVCFVEAPWSLLPSTSSDGQKYCTFVFGSCPKPQFETLGASPYMNSVLCCTWADRPQTEGQSQRRMRSLVTLGTVLPEDEQQLKGIVGTMVLQVDGSASKSCPQFANLLLHRRVAEGMAAPESMEQNTPNRLAKLFNVTHMDDKQFTERTGIQTLNNVIYIVYCEYSGPKLDDQVESRKEWPQANFALPKSLADCPKNSERATVRHRQDQYGFYYSQPIHLDGAYLQGDKLVSLEYCVFTTDASTPAYYYELREDLPPGHYCVLRVRGSCPTGFSDGSLSILEGPEKFENNPRESGKTTQASDYVEQNLTPDIERVRMYIKQSVMKIDRLDYHFCCRADSPSVDSPIQGFPTDSGPFFLYRVGDKCQQVEGMRVTEEHVCMDAPNRGDPHWWSLDRNHTWVPYRVKGLTPARIPYHIHCDVEINLCYYERDSPSADNRSIAVHNTGEWPIGVYALPNVHRSDMDTACPPGFTQHHMSLINQQPTFFEMEVIPMSLGPYFLELIGHNFSALNVHYCERDQPDQDGGNMPNTTPLLSDEEAAMQWPKGDYCVITTAQNNHCPPGLNRHTRAIAELCCRSDSVENPSPVNWPFTEDFFLFGFEKCLPIHNTHVERYLVRLMPTTELRHEPEWDILCHYMPLDWVEGETKWPTGEYMLPIGRRGGLKTAVINMVEYDDSLKQDHVAFNTSQLADQMTEGDGSTTYSCPTTFERARFTFVSKTVEKRIVEQKGGVAAKEYQVASVTAMEFCVRENKTEYTNDTGEKWPAGDYCVFTLNKECPMGMRASKEIPLKMPRFVLKSIDIVDEHGKLIKNRNWYEDARKHVVYFMQCCREDKSIILRLPPSNDGFYLASSSGLCSSVPGTVLDREKITSYLASPLTNKQITTLSERDMLLYRELVAQREGLMYLCYYHPGKGLYYSTGLSPIQLTTTLNITEQDLDTMAAMCGCAKNAFCIPHKQAECICKIGYFGDGRHTCRAITPLTDECADLCDPAAVCAERLDSGLRKKKQLLSHTCICRSGYAGDGFTCRPSCATRECQPFSRCVYDSVRGSTDCECVSGTIASDGRCNLDIYKSIQNEKDLPQALIHHDHCLSEETQSALLSAHPQRYFYVFVPEHQLIRTCDDMKSHIVVRDSQLTPIQLLSSSPENPIQLITENRTLIQVYAQNGTLVIDQHLAQQSPIRFTNGEMYLLSAPLKKTPYNPYNYNIPIIVVTLIVVLLIALIVALHYGLMRGRAYRIPPLTFRRRMNPRRTFWKRQGESVLVEEPDADE